MNRNTIKIILIISFVLSNVSDWVLEYLDTRHMGAAIPENVRDVYNEEEYRKWIAYHRESQRFGIVGSVASFLIGLLMLVFNFHALTFGFFDGLGLYLQYFSAILFLETIETIISIPFRYHDTFVIEEKYGMNRTNRKTFILDTVKSWIISSLLEVILVFLILFLYERFGDPGIILICAAVILVSILISLVVIPLMRIFNKFEPLQDGELKNALLSLCEKYGVQVKKIVVRDASRRTTRPNAFCTGLTKKKTISLDDNLVNGYDDDQIVAVFAHEFAHAKYSHMLKSLPFSIAQTVLMIFMLGVLFHILPAFEAFGFDEVNYYFALTLLTLITWPLAKGLEYIANRISRKHEYEADAFAAKEGYGEALVSALKKLSRDSLSNLNPHPLTVLIEYSHPTLSQRIEAIEGESRGSSSS